MSIQRNFPRTLLPIDRWAEIIGMDPRHFRQVTTTVKPETSCAKVWKQYSWQESDSVGRFDVADAIQQAERTIAQNLGYKLLPVWESTERTRTPKPSNPELLRFTTIDPRGFHLAIRAKWGHFLEGGQESKVVEPNGAAIAVAYTDEDLDGYFETATISFATTVTDENELAVFYPGEGGADVWEIRPLHSVSISAGVATITMWKHQLVLPDLIEALQPEAVVAAGAAADPSFLETVDVYRRFNAPATQVTLIWDPNLFNCGCTGGSTCCPVCGQGTQTGCLMPKDYEAGLLMYRPATFDEDTEAFVSAALSCGRNPDQLLMYYRAGLQDMSLDRPVVQMDPQWERAVAFYALALLDRDICDCAPVKGVADKWREDLARQTAQGSSFQLSDDVLNNPLGTSRGAQFAWNMIRERDRRLASPVRY
jgi:hypothetical protein